MKLLIVEDDRFILDVLVKRFKLENFEVYTSENGKKALGIIKKNAPDLILLDLVLPVMDGITFLEKIRKIDEYKNIPVIILTNLSDAQTIADCKKRGVNDYLIKTDWKIDEVVDRVKKELNI